MDIPQSILASPDQPFRVVAVLKPKQGESVAELTEILASVGERSRKESGITQYQVTLEPSTQTFYFVEQYGSVKVFNTHIAAEPFGDLMKCRDRFESVDIHFLQDI